MKTTGVAAFCSAGFALALALATACGGDDAPPAVGPSTPDAAKPPVTVRVLAINDFHGAIEAPSTSDLGGAAYLAAHVAKHRTSTSIFVSAGDLIGGSRLASGLFHDEPTVEVMNAMGLAIDGVGNHEFDEGTAELLRMKSGGCHPTDGCKSTPSFPGASFDFLAANVIDRASGKTFFPGYVVRDFDGAKIAFVGLTLEGTPATTLTSGVAGLEFRDEADTVSALVPEIRAQGAETIVVVIHQGGAQSGGIGDCKDFSGPIIDVVARMPPEVRLVVSGHSHAAYVCPSGDRVVTGASSHGQTLTVADITIDPATQKATSVTAQNFAVEHTVTPDPGVEQIVARVSGAVAPLRDAVVGTILETISSDGNGVGESSMGLVIADAMLFATSAAPFDAQFALMNPGGIRAPLLFPKEGAETVDGQVTYGEAFAVQPFGNVLTTITVTGAEVVAALDAGAFTKKPIHAAGLTYRLAYDRPRGEGVVADDVLVNGAAISPTATFRVTVNSIVITAFPMATNPTGAGVDLDALLAYLKSRSPVDTPIPRLSLKF